MDSPIPTSPKDTAKPRARGRAGRSARSNPKSAPTPAMQQYLGQKAEVGEAILFFRMGDFYETFYDDAKTISKVLGLALTARNKTSDHPIPLAGVPYHAVDGYIAKLVRAGYKVAISEQVEDPKQAKGVVKREVKRVITPGTLTDESLLDERADNYLAALCPEDPSDWTRGRIGLACAELASGRFFAQMLPLATLLDELARLNPAELLVPESGIDDVPQLIQQLRETGQLAVSPRPPHLFDPHMAQRALCAHFGVTSMAGFGFDGFDASLCAAAAVIDYLKETQKSTLDHLLKIAPRHHEDCVLIDRATLRSLEVERVFDSPLAADRGSVHARDVDRPGSLLAAIDRTVNPMGARRLRQWLCYPLRDADKIVARQQAITSLQENPQRLNRLRESLRDMGDVERILARLGVGRASPRDMVALAGALQGCARAADQVKRDGATEAAVIGDPSDPSILQPPSELLDNLAAAMRGHAELAAFLAGSLKEDAPPIVRDGGFIADAYDAELDRLRNVAKQGHQWLAEFQARHAKQTGIPTLKVGYNSVFGYYIEITNQHRDKVPPDYVRKQTVRNAERYITDELKRHESEVLGAADQARQLELGLFDEIRAKAAADLPRLGETADALATLDVVTGLAELSRQRGYCRPVLDQDAASGDRARLEIVDGRHPVLDVTLDARFVPNDCRLGGNDDQLLVITGPNMAGKSTYIRQVALLVLLAQTGSDVPAKSMHWTPVDRIFARVGASDELARGRSTFMVEMVETARILNNATEQSLVILDEIGRGTSTYDGLALAWAITEHIVQSIGCRTLFATHYHELTELADRLQGVANCNVAVKEELRPDGDGRDVVFLHKIVPGAADRSYGVHVAAMAAVPASVLRRAEAILVDLESSFTGRSRPRQLDGAPRKHDDQLMLFEGAAPLPDWWRELVNALDAVDIDRTTPLDALELLQQLRRIVRRGS